MAQIVVYTDDGVEVAHKEVPDTYASPSTISRLVCGNAHGVDGWLGRALRDARLIQQGINPERPSEKAMRLLAESRAAKIERP